MKLVRVLCSILSAAAICAGAVTAEASKITVEIGYFGISYTIPTEQGAISPGTFSNRFMPYEPQLPWAFKKVSPGVFHVRIPSEKQVYLKLDTTTRKVFVVSGGVFGEGGGSERIISDAEFRDSPPPFGPNPNIVHVMLPNPVLVYDTDTNDVGIFSAGLRLLGAEDIEIVRMAEDVYHVRAMGTRFQKSEPPTFKVINTRSKTLAVASGAFGESVAGSMPQNYRVTVENGMAAHAASESSVHEDQMMAELPREAVRESAWIESERELYAELLGKQRFDVLVVPVQVQDHAFDHIERSLMTKYLVRQIRTTTGLRISDPDTVERSLGWGSRTFSQQRVLALVNGTGAGKLVRVYAGHNRDMKMRLTVVVQDRPQGGRFTMTTPARESVFKDIAFSDERLPSEAFAERLPDVMAALRINGTRKEASRDRKGLGNVPVPAGPTEIAQGKGRSPLVLAAHLALLGAISPSESGAGERFLTRALAVLRGSSPGSTDAAFLKAYAFALLHRRPAALALLRTPSTPEQTALCAYLDGDLSNLPSLVEQIRNPIPKALMESALNDLRWSYDPQTARQRSPEALRSLPARWKPFVSRKYTQSDPWDVPDAIDLKMYLDEAYPVEGYGLGDIARGLAVRGELDPADTSKVDSAVPEHRRRLVKALPELLADDPFDQVLPLDIVDLAEEWAIRSVAKRIVLRANVQYLPEEGVALADRYDAYFKGHPELSVAKSKALWALARQKEGEERKNIGKTRNELNSAACVWFQGQTPLASYVCTGRYYHSDFPRREYWPRIFGALRYGDRDAYELQDATVTGVTTTGAPLGPGGLDEGFRTELRDLDLALRYSLSNFGSLERYHEKLVALGMKEAAEALVKRNSHRFAGSPARTAFLVRQYKTSGNEQDIPKLYEEAIRTTPGVWQSYYGLGSYFLSQGDAVSASKTFERYPFFREQGAKTEPQGEDTVASSNHAYHAGLALHWTGAIDDARRFYELSTGYQTGSGAGMRSEYYLALLNEDYERAAEEALTLYRRYSDSDAYSDYVRLQYVSGRSGEEERLFFSLDLMDKDMTSWAPIITALRMEGKSDAEVRGWLAENGKGRVGRAQAQLYYLRTQLVDRKPDPALADAVQKIEQQVVLKDNAGAGPKRLDKQGRLILSTPALFAGSSYAVRAREYDKANALLEPWWSAAQKGKASAEERSLLPYLAWSGVKSGRKQAIDEALGEYDRNNGRDFEYWLATAMIQAAAGKHDIALKALGLARTSINSSLANSRPVQAWYQLVDTCELLLDDTRESAYRDRALELARLYQRIHPFDSWAYAVEAKLAKSAEERLRPLALTMYLDRQSYRIADISKKEKEQALKWLERNNPFTKVSLPKGKQI